MKNIDFLPSRYREQNAVRRVQAWRFTVCALFVAGVGATAAGQYSFRAAARKQLAAVEAQHSAARAKTDQHAQLQQQLKDVHATAQLYAYLSHPWPRTQILGEIAVKLPAALTLTEIHVLRETLAVEATDPRRNRRSRGREPTDEEAKDKLPAAVRDLKKLREEHDAGRTVVEVSGHTHDLAALHTYVGQLSETNFFARCELASLEALSESKLSGTHEGRSRFTLRLALPPGYGQLGSPTTLPANEEVATAVPINHEETP